MLIITLSVDLLSLAIKTKTEGLINQKEVQISPPDWEVFPRQGLLLKPQNFGSFFSTILYESLMFHKSRLFLREMFHK